MQVSVTDAPRGDEIVVVIAVSDSGRPFHRIGENLDVSNLMSSNE
ncbi:MAG: amino acid synthesis family protein [Rhodospirillaceae bacterium]|nr:amino acid synthesis family protein [Rhodospirillaceae bacterium]